MTKNYKHYTFQEYIETFSSIQDSYDYYFEMQKEIDKLSDYNLHLVKSISDYEELLLNKNNIIDKAIEYIKNDWYAKNTRDIERMISFGDLRIDLLNILQGESNDLESQV